ncbi:hypothetical protein NUW58_g8559 [Xylaria curta]|uniref:Uncharacterized protein n=1 Tax=Xylaria curta TaxID=42375 RepID=A0ACC1N7H1_9PEZI|nr:hypothetical protein NUW58_g8559 [Xylaria curta]
MKNFGATLLLLAAGASSIAALPAPGTAHNVETRAPTYYALHLRDPKREGQEQGLGRGQRGGNARNGTLIPNVRPPALSSQPESCIY